ncbi:cell filamentation protein Fic [Pseudoclavibacter sp. RFBI5]|uniref:cell filamentation protein Fic n=1 Tax=Pseudoclavibacter sp. RFBI5 TaxID=2080578 RepID=UPI000CE8CBEF|nr:cell filamentation protein Fic [Pseudoclavibacter sp. RFBI5]PPG02773.1 cell filamentation protein Fic [Pseudoclavibacter sp. RFBI5]
MPSPPFHLLERRSDALARFRARLTVNVWDAASLEGSPLSLAEVESILSSEPVTGADEFDVDQVRALRDGFAVVADLVSAGAFRLDKWTSDAVHRTVARFEAIESGHFRGEGRVDGGGAVSLGQGATFQASAPGPGGATLPREHEALLASLAGLDPREQALRYSAAATRAQFYFDGNKRTSRLMMAGHLLAHGFDAIAVSASAHDAYDAALRVLFVEDRDDALVALLIDCRRRD